MTAEEKRKKICFCVRRATYSALPGTPTGVSCTLVWSYSSPVVPQRRGTDPEPTATDARRLDFATVHSTANCGPVDAHHSRCLCLRGPFAHSCQAMVITLDGQPLVLFSKTRFFGVCLSLSLPFLVVFPQIQTFFHHRSRIPQPTAAN